VLILNGRTHITVKKALPPWESLVQASLSAYAKTLPLALIFTHRIALLMSLLSQKTHFCRFNADRSSLCRALVLL